MPEETQGADNQDPKEIILPGRPPRLPFFLRLFWFRWQRWKLEKRTKAAKKETRRLEAETELMLEQMQRERERRAERQ